MNLDPGDPGDPGATRATKIILNYCIFIKHNIKRTLSGYNYR